MYIEDEQLTTLQPQTTRSFLKSRQVEPAVEIVKRFCTGAASFGSISDEAIGRGGIGSACWIYLGLHHCYVYMYNIYIVT